MGDLGIFMSILIPFETIHVRELESFMTEDMKKLVITWEKHDTGA